MTQAARGKTPQSPLTKAYSEVVRTLNEQNQALRGQLAELNTQIAELALNLRMYDKQRLQDIEQNRCNHDIVIKQLETMLRGRCLL